MHFPPASPTRFENPVLLQPGRCGGTQETPEALVHDAELWILGNQSAAHHLANRPAVSGIWQPILGKLGQHELLFFRAFIPDQAVIGIGPLQDL